MEQFFAILQKGLGQLDTTGNYEEGTLQELKESYEIPVLDGKESYRRLCEFVENYTLEQEAKNR